MTKCGEKTWGRLVHECRFEREFISVVDAVYNSVLLFTRLSSESLPCATVIHSVPRLMKKRME